MSQIDTYQAPTLFDFDEIDRREMPEKRTKAEVFADYDGFVEKFKPKKTTDDCYTPEAVYDAVLGFVRTLTDTTDREIVRPFWPGADFTTFPYPERCIVVDNPPFSIYSKIVRWYVSRKIDFFLFAPALTLFTGGEELSGITYLPISATITYENGAVVSTSFVTTLCRDLRIWIAPRLREVIEMIPRPKKKQMKISYPDNVVTSAQLTRIATRYVDFKVRADECLKVANLDGLRNVGKHLFGGGYLLSERAAAERAAAERAAAAADLAVELSPRELAKIELLNKKTNKNLKKQRNCKL